MKWSWKKKKKNYLTKIKYDNFMTLHLFFNFLRDFSFDWWKIYDFSLIFGYMIERKGQNQVIILFFYSFFSVFFFCLEFYTFSQISVRSSYLAYQVTMKITINSFSSLVFFIFIFFSQKKKKIIIIIIVKNKNSKNLFCFWFNFFIHITIFTISWSICSFFCIFFFHFFRLIFIHYNLRFSSIHFTWIVALIDLMISFWIA